MIEVRDLVGQAELREYSAIELSRTSSWEANQGRIQRKVSASFFPH